MPIMKDSSSFCQLQYSIIAWLPAVLQNKQVIREFACINLDIRQKIRQLFLQFYLLWK